MISQDKKPSTGRLSSIIAHWESCEYSLPVVFGDIDLSKQMTSEGLHPLYCCSHVKVVSNAPPRMRIQAKPKHPRNESSATSLVVLCKPPFPPSAIVNKEQLRYFLDQAESLLHNCQNCTFYCYRRGNCP